MNVNLPHTATDTDSRDRLLSDLRQAVAAEIAATKSRAAVFRAEVWSGKLHTESERNHIYTFLLDTVVPIADDMPGELHVGGKVYPCRIVAVEGLRVSVLLATAPARVIERATLVALPWVALTRLHEALGALRGAKALRERNHRRTAIEQGTLCRRVCRNGADCRRGGWTAGVVAERGTATGVNNGASARGYGYCRSRKLRKNPSAQQSRGGLPRCRPACAPAGSVQPCNRLNAQHARRV